jgi:cytochrome c peroxidase
MCRTMSGWRSCVIAAIWLMLPVPVAAQTFTGAMSGTWWNPGRDGEGQYIGFERVGERNVAMLAYFTYDADGNARWLVGTVDFAAGATRVTIPLIQAQGATFGVGFRSGDVTTTASGSATLDYLACDRLRFAYAGDDDTFEFELSRLVGLLDGADCDAEGEGSSTDRFVGAQSGSWWDPQRSGEGMFTAFERHGERRLAVLFYFTYDDDGRPRWLIGGAEHEAGAERIEIPLAVGSGARFGSAFDSADVQRVPAGRAMLESTGCAGMRFRYTGHVTFGLDLRRAAGELLDLPCTLTATPPSQVDIQLRALIAREHLRGDPAVGRELPGIDAPLAKLGKLLFFSKSLGGDRDAACASCHHPALGGADGLALPIGVAALDADVLGPGRRQAYVGLLVGRNAPTFFNAGLYDNGLFWDSRVESLGRLSGRNGAGSGIRTPDSAAGVADPSAGGNLVAAQARFPVVSPAEMLGSAFPGMSDAQVRHHLAARLGDYGSGAGLLPPSEWLARFREAFDSDEGAEALITFDSIAVAIGEYQRSAVFVESPWSRYVRGDDAAISESAKRGALVFFRRVDEGGGQCTKCHGGDFFTDESHHVIAMPQVGPGAGDPDDGDFGRTRASGASSDQFAFRTPSLLNVELTAPYGHAGAYGDLETVIDHYVLPEQTVSDSILSRIWCALPPFDADPDCPRLADTVGPNTTAALTRLQALRASGSPLALPVIDRARVGPEMVPHVVEFLRTLTDPCLRDRACFGRWIPDAADAPDGLQLNALDASGNPL